ncbi:hypothetical protein D9M72_589120 [compost metagenome]
MVAIITDHTVPMTTTKSIVLSVCPNQRTAKGTQHTLGKVCRPKASEPSVSSMILDELVRTPSGKPITTPTT